MVASMRIDVATVGPGQADTARVDGVPGQEVTVVALGSGTNLIQLLDVPPNDPDTLANFTQNGNTATFTPAAGAWGEYRIRVTNDPGSVTETSITRIYGIRSPNKGLLSPAFGEVANPNASIINQLDDSENNATAGFTGPLAARTWAGWSRVMREVVETVESGAGGGGEVNTGANVGGGSGLFRDKIGVTLNFRSLVAGANMAITAAADTLTLAANAVTGLTNLGGGAQIGAGRVGDNLQMRSLVAGTGITIGQTADELEISASGSSGEVNTGANVGTGFGLFRDKTGVTLNFRSLVSGSGITFGISQDELLISATGGGSPFPGSFVVVTQKSDFPAPVGGFIDLAPGVYYYCVSGTGTTIDLGTDVLRMADGTILTAPTAFSTTITGTGANLLVKPASVNCVISNINFVGAGGSGGYIVDITGSDGDSWYMRDCKVISAAQGAYNGIRLNGFGAAPTGAMRVVSFENVSTGISLEGNWRVVDLEGMLYFNVTICYATSFSVSADTVRVSALFAENFSVVADLNGNFGSTTFSGLEAYNGTTGIAPTSSGPSPVNTIELVDSKFENVAQGFVNFDHTDPDATIRDVRVNGTYVPETPLR